MRGSFSSLWCVVWVFFVCLFATRVPNRQLLLMLNFSLYVCSTVKLHLERLFQACFDNSPLGIRLKAGILLF